MVNIADRREKQPIGAYFRENKEVKSSESWHR